MVSVIQKRPATTQHAEELVRHGDGSLEEHWRKACADLNARAIGSEAPVTNDVSITLQASPSRLRTLYTISVTAPTAPAFTLTRRLPGSAYGRVGTTDEKFESVVAVETDDSDALRRFFTPDRRSMVLQLLSRVPDAVVTNEEIRAASLGVDEDSNVVGRTISRLAEVADAMKPCWADVQLDERAVLSDLFDSGRSDQDIADRFSELYFANSVSWLGEVLQVGSVDAAGRRAAVFVGTADGRTAESGRVVALTALDPAFEVNVGDVVKVSGSMWNLDPRKRLFLIE